MKHAMINKQRFAEGKPGYKTCPVEVILAHLPMGHPRRRHSLIFKQREEPGCKTYQTPCLVKHFLIECRNFSYIRKLLFNANNMKDEFKNIN